MPSSKRHQSLLAGQQNLVVIPASFRKALGISAGDEVVLRLEDEELRITTPKRRLDRARRQVRKHVKPGDSLALGLALKAPVYTVDQSWKSLKIGIRIHVIR